MAYRKKQSGSETRKREPIIGFRANPEERAEIEAAAKREGYTLSSYVRARSLAAPKTRAVRRPPVETAQLAVLLGKLGGAGGALQHLAQQPAADLPQAELLAAIADFRETAAAIMRAIGKRPLTPTAQPSSGRTR